ncbi:ABC transporter permease [uncultured Mobiluncus sp.]|uniref:ABC transporter permease n=1 Tax=uncultured Mobiluncus sp. TaxID=293425 RepID=UPI0025ECBB17|nr:ABC transporter permease [uncultured Mobiluncus sp.]
MTKMQENAENSPVVRERLRRLQDTPLHDALPKSQGLAITQLIKEVLPRRELLSLLIHREIRSRYKDSALGKLWSLVRPLVSLLIYYIAIGKFLGAARAIDDFAIFVFAGLTAWQLFNEIVSSGTGSLVANSGILKKVYVPRELFPLASAGAALFNFVTQLVILTVGALLISGLPLDIRLLYFPVALLVLLVWGISFALMLSAMNVYLRDTQYLVEVALMVGFWASPIVYSWTMVSTYAHSILIQEVYLANPMTLVVLGFQKTFWIASTPDAFPAHLGVRLLISLLVGVIVLLICERGFSRTQGNFAQEL